MKKHLLYLFLFLLSFIVGCSSSKKAFKQAGEYEKSGLYVEAAEYDIKALKEKSDYKDARVQLKRVAPLAYAELLKRAENLETAENRDAAVDGYAHLKQFLEDCTKFGIVFETVKVNVRLSRAKRRAAEYHYTHGEKFFKAKQWQKAANAYLKAHHFIDNYNKSFVKAIQSFVNAGDRFLEEENYIKALRMYNKARIIAPGHKMLTNKLANAHYVYGRALFGEGQYRQSLEEFEKANEMNPEFKDVQRWADRAYEKAVRFIAVVPFVNESPSPVDGYFLASEILTAIQHRNLKFVDFMDHAQTVAMTNGIRRGRYGSISETQLLDAAKKEGLNSIIWGKIKNVKVKDRPEKVTEYEYDKIVTVKDSSGKDVEEKEPIFYREHVRKRTVALTVDYVILDCETGKYLDKQRFNDKLVDEAVWIAYQGSIYDLPEDKRPLLDAPRNPQDVRGLLDQMIQKISERIGRQVAQYFK